MPYSEQIEKKKHSLQRALKDSQIPFPELISFRSVGNSGIRDRVDLTYEAGRYGFYKKAEKEILNVEQCPLMSPALFSFFQDVRKIHMPVRKGSLRLRVSPSGKKGLWLDFANEDVRDLLKEKKSLSALLDLGFVEIGQKRKMLTADMKLKDPEFHPWTRTWVQQVPIQLNSVVGSFSQVGDLANQALIQELEVFFSESASTEWVEFGSGQGNLTFPLLGTNRRVEALEFDPLALQGLQKTLNENPAFKDRIQLTLGDFQRKKPHSFRRNQGVLVNPPRSGLQKFLDPLFGRPQEERPRDFVYMSCFLESFVQDGSKLKELGYEIQKLSIVDQFPQSPHFEILSLWKLR